MLEVEVSISCIAVTLRNGAFQFLLKGRVAFLEFCEFDNVHLQSFGCSLFKTALLIYRLINKFHICCWVVGFKANCPLVALQGQCLPLGSI